MPSQDKQRWDSPFLQEGNLETPFLDEELFVKEAEPELEARLAVLEAESPFLRAFESGATEAQTITEEEDRREGRHHDRVRVRDTLAVPFRWICRIWVQRRVKTPDGHEEKRGLAPAGTGLLISPRHVLTAAHVLHGVDERGSVVEEHEAIHVEVAPAANGDLTPFGRIEATSWDLPPKWKPASHSSQFDYAVITLKGAVGERTPKKWKSKSLCFWGSPTCGANTSLDAVPSALAKKLVEAKILTAGYPTAKKGEMWCAAGKLSAGSATDAHLIKQGIVEDWAKKAGTFFLTAGASEGQSGSPVWIEDSGKRYLVGVLVRTGEKNSTVLNLREEVVRQIQSWTGQTTAGEKTGKLFEEPEWLEECSEEMDESAEEVFESPTTFTTVGRSLTEPEEYVQAADRRSPLRIPEEAEWFDEVGEPETFGEAEDGFAEDFEDEAFEHDEVRYEDQATEEYDTGTRPLEEEEAAEDEFDAKPGGRMLEERQLPAPKNKDLRHFHVKKTRNVAGNLVAAGTASLMKPGEMMPAYINPFWDTLVTDTSATGLQGRLSNLMLGSRWSSFLSPESIRLRKAHATDKLYVALVDLTGAKLSKPEFAGWASMEAVGGASIPKILVLYALFQLRFDLNHLASANGITKKADLLKRAESHWKDTGLASWPSLGQLFNFVEGSGKPVQVKFQSWLDAAQFSINSNCSVTRLMNGLGFDYIGSVALQSGLRHPALGGLWLGTTYECGNQQSTRWQRDPIPQIASCIAGGRSGHHVTALSAATYYTLLAQGRLVDDSNSRQMITYLARGCTLSGGFREGLEALGDVRWRVQKCGLLGECKHESMLLKRGRFRYVAVALFKGVGFPFKLLIQDLDKIIRDRNP